MATPSLSDLDTLLNWSLQAKEYLKGEPFTLRIYNFDADYVALDSYALDDKQKASESILPDLSIPKGGKSTAAFKANVFFLLPIQNTYSKHIIKQTTTRFSFSTIGEAQAREMSL